MSKGYKISFSDLDTKKPKGFGILANDYKNIIGKKLNKGLQQWDFLNYDDLTN
jgi:N-acetylneuraminate synthase